MPADNDQYTIAGPGSNGSVMQSGPAVPYAPPPYPVGGGSVGGGWTGGGSAGGDSVGSGSVGYPPAYYGPVAGGGSPQLVPVWSPGRTIAAVVAAVVIAMLGAVAVSAIDNGPSGNAGGTGFRIPGNGQFGNGQFGNGQFGNGQFGNGQFGAGAAQPLGG